MGNKAQKIEAPSAQVCCITLNMKDRLRLLDCPPDLTPKIRQTIQKSWGPIQSECTYHGSHEFKLKGRPWFGQGNEAVPARRLLAAVLSTMAKNGWNLIQSVDLSRKENGKDALFFERGKPDPDVSMFAMSFNKEDRIRLIDAPTFMPYLKQAVETSWPKGIKHEIEYCGSLELKLAGSPWKPDGKHAVQSKLLVSGILTNFRAVGYKLYASVDISEGRREVTLWNAFKAMFTRSMPEITSAGDLESWVFRKVNENWQ